MPIIRAWSGFAVSLCPHCATVPHSGGASGFYLCINLVPLQGSGFPMANRRTDTGRAAARDFFSLEAVDFDQLQDEVAPEARP